MLFACCLLQSGVKIAANVYTDGIYIEREL